MTTQSNEPHARAQTRGLDAEQPGMGPSPLDSHSTQQLHAMAAAQNVPDHDVMTRQQLMACLDTSVNARNAGDPEHGNPAPTPAAPTDTRDQRPDRPSF